MPRSYKKKSRLKGGVISGRNDDDGSFHSATSSQPPSPEPSVEPSVEQDPAIEFLAAMRTPTVAVDDDDDFDDDDERQKLLDRAGRETAAANKIDQALKRYTRRRRAQANLSGLVDRVEGELDRRQLEQMQTRLEEERVARREAYERQQQIENERRIREERNLAERMDRARHTIAKNIASRRQIQEAKDIKDELERLRQIQEETREREARNRAEEKSRIQAEDDRARKLATILSHAQKRKAQKTKKIKEKYEQTEVQKQIVQNWIQKAKDLVKKKKFSQYITDLKSNIKTGNITSIAASIQAGEQILREGNISPTDRDSLEDALKLARDKLVKLTASNIFGTNSNQYINQERLKKSSLSRRTGRDQRNIGVPDTGDLVIIRPAPPSILFPNTRQIVNDLEGRLAVVLTGRDPAQRGPKLHPLPNWNDNEHYIVLVLPSNDGYLNDRVFELEIYNKDLEWPTPPIKCSREYSNFCRQYWIYLSSIYGPGKQIPSSDNMLRYMIKPNPQFTVEFIPDHITRKVSIPEYIPFTPSHRDDQYFIITGRPRNNPRPYQDRHKRPSFTDIYLPVLLINDNDVNHPGSARRTGIPGTINLGNLMYAGTIVSFSDFFLIKAIDFDGRYIPIEFYSINDNGGVPPGGPGAGPSSGFGQGFGQGTGVPPQPKQKPPKPPKPPRSLPRAPPPPPPARPPAMSEARARTLLGLSADDEITRDLVKKAYKKLILKNHPDKLPDDMSEADKKKHEQLFIEQTEAKDYLDRVFNLQLGGGTRKRRLRKNKKTKRNKKTKSNKKHKYRKTKKR